MKKTNQFSFLIPAFLFMFFIGFTIAVKLIDVKAIGPKDSFVGFATMNGWWKNITGVNFTLYDITDWLGVAVMIIPISFAGLGLYQLIKRKSLKKVDVSLLILGGFYIVMILFYIAFEFIVINRRPILIEGYLEVSYPSSTTMLVACVMPTAVMQINERINNVKIKISLDFVCIIVLLFGVIGRIVSGVHWLSDIMGGIILSTALCTLYYSLTKKYFKAK